MNEFAEKNKVLMKENEAIKADLEKAIDDRNEAMASVEVLTERLQHLLESDFIRRFDEYDHLTHIYKLDIRDADRVIKTLDEVKLMANSQQSELGMLKECIVRMTMERMGVS